MFQLITKMDTLRFLLINKNRDGEDYIHREIHRSAFSRWFSVDEEVYEVNKINANLADGILSITIPKKDEAVKPLPRKIEVS